MKMSHLLRKVYCKCFKSQAHSDYSQPKIPDNQERELLNTVLNNTAVCLKVVDCICTDEDKKILYVRSFCCYSHAQL